MDVYNYETIEKLSYHYKEILKLIGEDAEREGLLDTPRRVARQNASSSRLFMI